MAREAFHGSLWRTGGGWVPATLRSVSHRDSGRHRGELRHGVEAMDLTTGVMTMEFELDGLVSVLTQEIDVYETLLSTLQEEKAAVVHSHIEELNECTKKKENCVLKLRILDEQRAMVWDSLSGDVEPGDRPATLAHLASVAEEPHKSRLEACLSDLRALTGAISDINRSNESLLRHSMAMVKSSIRMLNHAIAEPPVYGSTGAFGMCRHSGAFLSGTV